MLVAAKDDHVKKVVYASSCAVYRDAKAIPISETAPPNPKSPYAAAKLAGEHYCSVFSGIYDLPAISLRYFNVYGPKKNPSSEYAAAIPGLIGSGLADRPLIIYGDGLAILTLMTGICSLTWSL